MSIERTAIIGRGIYVHPDYFWELPDEVRDRYGIVMDAYRDKSACFFGKIIKRCEEGYAYTFGETTFKEFRAAKADDTKLWYEAQKYGIKGNIEWFFGVMVD